MSKQFFKVSVKYDTNCGYSDHKTWYVRCNNTIDYFTMVDEYGEIVKAVGTDSYIKCLSYALSLKNFDDVVSEVKVDEIGLDSIPNKALESLDSVLYCSTCNVSDREAMQMNIING